MATLKQIQNAADNFWATHGPEVIARQNAYLAAHGHYWQGIESHGTLPDDGVATAPVLTKRPTDQLDRWLDFFAGYSLPSTWPIAVRIDVYDGPQGKGWVVVVRFTKTGKTYQMASMGDFLRVYGEARESVKAGKVLRELLSLSDADAAMLVESLRAL